jgi:hypothetical protein
LNGLVALALFIAGSCGTCILHDLIHTAEGLHHHEHSDGSLHRLHHREHKDHDVAEVDLPIGLIVRKIWKGIENSGWGMARGGAQIYLGGDDPKPSRVTTKPPPPPASALSELRQFVRPPPSAL